MASSRPKVLAIVLAGGEGKRLMPLTMDRAKPAVPFGGTYRLIDFVLSNLANAGMRQIAVLTQYKSHSLDKHISVTWRMSTLLGNYVTPVPAQQRLGPRWYQGSADAIFQSKNLFVDEDPDYVVVFGADNIYRMDVEQMLDAHIDGGLGCTVAGIRVPRAQATEFGVIDAAADNKIKEFLEKPADPPGLPDDPDASFASMGNYIFTCDALVESLYADAENLDSRHDMGGDIIPSFVSQGQAQVYDFTKNEVPGVKDRDRAYWRDVGSIDAYHEAHMDLVSVDPVFNLYNNEWPIWSNMAQLPGGQVHPGRHRHGLDRQPRLHHLRRPDRRLRAVSQRAGGQGCRDHPVGDLAERPDRRGRRDRAGHPGQERAGRAGCHGRRRHRPGSRPRLHRLRRRHHRRRQRHHGKEVGRVLARVAASRASWNPSKKQRRRARTRDRVPD